MDGFKRKITHSLQFKLSVWLSTVILLIAVATGIFSLQSAFDEANELQDDQLKQVAALINRHYLPAAQAKAHENIPGSDPQSRYIVQTLPQPGGNAPSSTDVILALPADLPDGLQTVTVGNDAWRLFVRTMDAGSRIAVGQPTAEREEIAQNSALRTLTSMAFLIPVLLVLAGVLIRQIFKPLKQLAADLDCRTEWDLRAVSDTRVPSEVRPFVVAINQLLSRVARSTAVQRRFVADAAHELRSPLTALSLQAERLETSDMSNEARERLGSLQSGLIRTRALLNQLLASARAHEVSEAVVTTVSMQQVLRQVLEDLMPLAEAKQIDLGVLGEPDAWISAHEVDLKTLIKNLVDNAIRYTPAGGWVDISVQTTPNHVILQVDDNGPGIAEHDRERVFDPFYRVLGNDEAGSGLGLSIVKTIAVRIGAKISLSESDADEHTSGLRVTVMFPVAHSDPHSLHSSPPM